MIDDNASKVLSVYKLYNLDRYRDLVSAAAKHLSAPGVEGLLC
jgi:hypothetical protein